MSQRLTVESVARNGHIWKMTLTNGTSWPAFWTSDIEAGFVRSDIVPKAGDDVELGGRGSGYPVTFLKVNGVLIWRWGSEAGS